MNNIRKVFSVIIHDKSYNVYDIEGKEHEGQNGVHKTYWLYYESLPEGVIPPLDSESWEPFCSQINRFCWELKFREFNSSKEKYGEEMFSHNTICEMWCNGRQVFQFTTRGVQHAMSKAQVLMVDIREGSYELLDPVSVFAGAEHRIYYHGLPASAKTCSEIWEVYITPDYSDEYPEDIWWNEYAKRQPYMFEEEDDRSQQERDFIRTNAIDDTHIFWNRN